MSIYSEILSESPKAYWPMQETAGGVLVDVTGNGFDATLVPPYTLDAHDGPDCAGPTNRSVEFQDNGVWNSGSWADAPNLLSGNTDAAVEFLLFMRPGARLSHPTIVSQRDGPLGAGFASSLVIEPAFNGELFVRWAGSSASLTPASAFVEGCWNHVFVEHQASTRQVRAWLNGCAATPFTQSGDLASFPFRIVGDPVGPDSVTHLLNGFLAHVAVYDHLGPGESTVIARAREACGRCPEWCAPGGGWHLDSMFW